MESRHGSEAGRNEAARFEEGPDEAGRDEIIHYEGVRNRYSESFRQNKELKERKDLVQDRGKENIDRLAQIHEGVLYGRK